MKKRLWSTEQNNELTEQEQAMEERMLTPIPDICSCKYDFRIPN